MNDNLLEDLSKEYGLNKRQTFGSKFGRQGSNNFQNNFLQLVDNEEIISNEKQEMMRADSPIHSNMEDEIDSRNSIDEFRDLKQAKNYKGVQEQDYNKQHQRNQAFIGIQNQNQAIIPQTGHTNMVKDYYRKESKENNLTKKKSNENLLFNSSHAHSQSREDFHHNNIIIDLTNQIIEEHKQKHLSNSVLQQNQDQQPPQSQYSYNSQPAIPKDVVTQKDIEEFKKQIQIDLQRLTQVLEENTKKQSMMQIQEQILQQKSLEQKVQRSIQADFSQDEDNAEQSNADISPMPQFKPEDASHNSSKVDLNKMNNNNNNYEAQHSHKLSNGNTSNYNYNQLNDSRSMGDPKYDKQNSLQQQVKSADKGKMGRALAHGYRPSSKGPQSSNVQASKNPNNVTNSSVRSGNSSFVSNIQQHQRLQSANNNPQQQQNPHFYLNLGSLQKTNPPQQTKNQGFYTGNRNTNLKNSKERKQNHNNYITKSPQSYSSMTSQYIKQSKSAGKSGNIQNQQQNYKSNNGSYVILEEANQQDISMNDQIIGENEDLKQNIHQLRLKNAEHRTEINKVKRENSELQTQYQLLEEKYKQLERQRKKDCDYILKQENEIEKMREQKGQQTNLIKVQEDQILNLKNMLNSTINVKIKYENIIKKLVENEGSRDLVLNIIEQMQQQQQQQPLDQTQSQFNISQNMHSHQKSTNGYSSMNQTQNMSSILANAAQKIMAKSAQGIHGNKIQNQMHLDYFKPSQNMDDSDQENEDNEEYQNQQQQYNQQDQSDSSFIVTKQQKQFLEQQQEISGGPQQQYFQAQKQQYLSQQQQQQLGDARNTQGENRMQTKLKLAELPM